MRAVGTGVSGAGSASAVARWAVLAYGLAAYAMFLGVITYAMGFVSNVAVPRSIDAGGRSASLLEAILVNAGLLAVFAIQHTIMARPWFKHRLARIMPSAAERSTFVITASAALALLMWQWRPVALDLWRIESAAGQAAMLAVCALGFGIVLYSSFLIDHFELFGLRQAWSYFRGRAHTPRGFAERSLYKHVRHPLMLGFLIAFWATPHMTVGHLFFAVLISGYVVMGIWFEERDLSANLGRAYEQYRRRTPMLIPRIRAAGRNGAARNATMGASEPA